VIDSLAVTWFPNSVIRRWPAIILAVSRTAKVNGRMIFLIDSIKTINGIKAGGVLCGTKWANMCFEWLIHPKSINESHIVRENENEGIKWLVDVKV
jgi:hypothetical protein